MKKFEPYKNIRKKAVIFGVPISLFALMMMSVLASLMVIIFSFSFGIIIGILVFNAALYVALIRITHNPQLFQMTKAFPKIISNKQNSGFDYEQD
jgi:type IV secretory pathway VirB3-like protein